MTLLEEIRAAFPDLTPETRDDGLIAATLSNGRTKIVKTLGGVGSVLEALGPVAGGQFLDELKTLAATNSAVKWAFNLIERGELDFASPATRAMISTLVPAGALQTALLNIAVAPDTVTPQQVAAALAGNI